MGIYLPKMNLELRHPSPPHWLQRVLTHPDELLHDVTHCEKKAAGTVLGFIFKDPSRAAVYSRLAREELGHFEACLGLMRTRGLAFGPLEPTAYAGALAKAARGELPAVLGVAAIIEARSAERLAMLRDACEDAELRGLFEMLHPPEERHVALLLGVAGDLGLSAARLGELLDVEADWAGDDRVRMHG